MSSFDAAELGIPDKRVLELAELCSSILADCLINHFEDGQAYMLARLEHEIPDRIELMYMSWKLGCTAGELGIA